jgi:hypothetical protein
MLMKRRILILTLSFSAIALVTLLIPKRSVVGLEEEHGAGRVERVFDVVAIEGEADEGRDEDARMKTSRGVADHEPEEGGHSLSREGDEGEEKEHGEEFDPDEHAMVGGEKEGGGEDEEEHAIEGEHEENANEGEHEAHDGEEERDDEEGEEELDDEGEWSPPFFLTRLQTKRRSDFAKSVAR